jgi:hypothetical protein
MNKQPPLPATLLTRREPRPARRAPKGPAQRPTAEASTSMPPCWAYSTIKGSSMRSGPGTEDLAGGGSRRAGGGSRRADGWRQ